jgi:hypothetical protein
MSRLLWTLNKNLEVGGHSLIWSSSLSCIRLEKLNMCQQLVAPARFEQGTSSNGRTQQETALLLTRRLSNNDQAMFRRTCPLSMVDIKQQNALNSACNWTIFRHFVQEAEVCVVTDWVENDPLLQAWSYRIEISVIITYTRRGTEYSIGNATLITTHKNLHAQKNETCHNIEFWKP